MDKEQGDRKFCGQHYCCAMVHDQCRATVYDIYSGLPDSLDCAHPATIRWRGKYYCDQHDPRSSARETQDEGPIDSRFEILDL